MAILKILKDSDPMLRKKSREVSEITPRIITLLDDMRDTMNKANGYGLAAVQVGVLRRIFIIQTEEGELYEFINPKIIETSDEIQNELEGCLSVPNRWGITQRPKKVTVKAQDRYGKPFMLTGTDLLARGICHEYDHLDGVLYTDNVVRMLSEEEIEEFIK